METLTDKQLKVFNLIRDKMKTRGYGPTVREIGKEFGIVSPNGVVCHLKALEKKGLIIRSPHKSRAIEITDGAKDEADGLPFIGTVAAGMTTLAFEQTDRINIGDMMHRKNCFVLKVKGESMIEAHIADGDYVVVKKQKSAQPGQMVVAQTEEGEATLKYWFPEAHRIRLQPANASMKPIYVESAIIVGVVVGVVRKVT
jgi:repressor LexA